jgi:hypothetical protein
LVRKGRPVQVRRMPPRKVLRAHLLGLSNGLFTALLVIVFWVIFDDLCLIVEEFCEVFIDSTLIFKDPADLNGLSWIFIALYVVIFALGSRSLGAFFVIFIALYAIFADISSTSSPEWWLWVTMSQWYIIGYLFGAIFATLYNDLVFLHLILFRQDLVKIAFAYNPQRKVNIIKSPNEKEEFTLLQVLKPILYYTCNIRNADSSKEVVNRSADKIISLVYKAFKKMTKSDKKKLKELFFGTRFKLTEQSLENLTLEKLPEDVISQLETIKNQEFTSKEEFLEVLKETIGEEQTVSYKLLILKHAEIEMSDEEFLELLYQEFRPALKERDSEAIDKVERGELLLERYLELKERKLYNYRILNPPQYPYTIAFVANPYVLRLNDTKQSLADFETDSNNYVEDPIIKNRDLFLQSVERAMSALEEDDVVGNPEIWSRIRVITVFDDKIKKKDIPQCGLLQPYRNNLELNERESVAENLLDPMERMHQNYRTLLRGEKKLETYNAITVEDLIFETDVIFALSASSEFDRSSAHYCDWLESIQKDTEPNPLGEKYEYDPDPANTKPLGGVIMRDIITNTCKPLTESPRRFTCIHDYYSNNPGRVALNVIGASNKTFIHEFGHAMSSAFHGAIVDEYFDRHEIFDDDTGGSSLEYPQYYVNRIERRSRSDGTVVPIHKIFAKYNRTIFYSDPHHPSGEENWIGYFPARKDPYSVCTMDRNFNRYRFDELLSNFIYDRLMVKINRQKAPPKPPTP